MNETKQHILQTSLILFLQKSYKDVTMKDIVKQTELSKGAFYHYFTSKEELYKEIAAMFFSMGTTNYAAFNQLSLSKFYEDYIDHTAISFQKLNDMIGEKNPNKASINLFKFMTDAISRFPEFLKLELADYNQSIEAWTRVIEHAKETGEINTTSSSTEIADLFLYCTDGVFMRDVNSEENNNYANDLLKAFKVIYNNIKA